MDENTLAKLQAGCEADQKQLEHTIANYAAATDTPDSRAARIIFDFARVYSLWLDDRYLDDLSCTFLEWLATSLYADKVEAMFDAALVHARKREATHDSE